MENRFDDDIAEWPKYHVDDMLLLIQKMMMRSLREHARFLHQTFENSILDQFCSKGIETVIKLKRYLICGSYNLVMLSVTTELRKSRQAPLVALYARIIMIQTRLQTGFPIDKKHSVPSHAPIDLIVIDLDDTEADNGEGASDNGVGEGASDKSVKVGASGNGVKVGASGKGMEEGASGKGSSKDAKDAGNTNQEHIIELNDVRLSGGLLAEIGQYRDELLLCVFDAFLCTKLQSRDVTVLEFHFSRMEEDLFYISRGPFNGPVYAELVVLMCMFQERTQADVSLHVAKNYAKLVGQIAAELA